MATVLIRAEVRDYDVWKPVFDSLEEMRKRFGESSYRILREEDGSDRLVALFDWDTMEHAHKYFDSPELKEAMRRGAVRKPEIEFLNEVDRCPEMNPVFSDLL
jgi:heme-degrading monooxygenase HmoA